MSQRVFRQLRMTNWNRTRDTEWHAREMTVVDPDGNRLRFSTAVTQ